MNYQTQFERQELIKEKTGICIVTCGRCGGVVLAKSDDFVDEEDLIYAGHHCHNCNFKSDCCDFPDLYN